MTIEQYELPHLSHQRVYELLVEVDALPNITFTTWEADFTESIMQAHKTVVPFYLTPKQRSVIFKIIRKYSDLLDN